VLSLGNVVGGVRCVHKPLTWYPDTIRPHPCPDKRSPRLEATPTNP